MPAELSTTQCRQAIIARALMNDPRLVLCDHPTADLDLACGREIMSSLSELNRSGTTVVFTTHHDQVAQFARRILRLDHGRLVSDEPVIERAHSAG